jgi:hypothetical protein
VPNQELYYLGTTPNSASDNSGVVDHIAFLATDHEKFQEHLEAKGIQRRNRFLPDFKLFQTFIADPDGLVIELNFFGVEEAPDWGGENYAEMPRVPETANSGA